MRNIYDYVFYSVYKNTSIINKSIPEWSTIIAISILLALNIFSILLYIEYDIESIGEKVFGAIPLILTGVNYFYFLKNKRYLNILKKYDKTKNNLIYDILILAYACISVFILFSLLEAELKYPLILITVIILSVLITYFMSIKKKETD